MTVTVRRATVEDVPMLWGWSKDPETRAQSRRTYQIPWDEYLEWITPWLDGDDRAIYVALDDGEPIGEARMERLDDGWEVSLSIAPGHRGQRLATPIIEAAAAEAPPPVHAVIRVGNTRSRRAFAAAGFVVISVDDEFVHMTRAG